MNNHCMNSSFQLHMFNNNNYYFFLCIKLSTAPIHNLYVGVMQPFSKNTLNYSLISSDSNRETEPDIYQNMWVSRLLESMDDKESWFCYSTK